MQVLSTPTVVFEFLTCLVSRAFLANSACAIKLLEESGTMVSHLASRGDCVS